MWMAALHIVPIALRRLKICYYFAALSIHRIHHRFDWDAQHMASTLPETTRATKLLRELLAPVLDSRHTSGRIWIQCFRID
ncbi:MAG: hypothetical protein ACYTEQ_03575 [Planctomycetota bacterium]